MFKLREGKVRERYDCAKKKFITVKYYEGERDRKISSSSRAHACDAPRTCYLQLARCVRVVRTRMNLEMLHDEGYSVKVAPSSLP